MRVLRRSRRGDGASRLIMGSLALAAVATGFLLVAGLMGLVTMLILMESGVPRLTAFGWGAALGPVGVIVSISIAMHRAKTARAPEDVGVPW